MSNALSDKVRERFTGDWLRDREWFAEEDREEAHRLWAEELRRMYDESSTPDLQIIPRS